MNQASVQYLNERFRIRGVAEIIADRGGMPAVWVEGRPSVAHGANGTVYLHGGHVAAWRPRGMEEVLWLSHKSLWQPNKAIRGGVPICFPWFGPRKDHPESPAHGFARTGAWQLDSLEQTDAGVVVVLSLQNSAASRALWPCDFQVRQRITFGDELLLALEMRNTASAAWSAEEAQHTYFSVGDVRQARVLGLDGARYIDKTDGFKEKRQEGAITIAAETDRVYLNASGPIHVEDPVKGRRITITKEQSRNTVVWNPWIAKAKAMADFGDEEWMGMLCVETANVGEAAIALAPGQSHTMTTRLSVTPL